MKFASVPCLATLSLLSGISPVAADRMPPSFTTVPRTEPLICCRQDGSLGCNDLCSPDCPTTECRDLNDLCLNSGFSPCDVTNDTGETFPSCCDASGEPNLGNLENFCGRGGSICQNLVDNVNEKCCLFFSSRGENRRFSFGGIIDVGSFDFEVLGDDDPCVGQCFIKLPDNQLSPFNNLKDFCLRDAPGDGLETIFCVNGEPFEEFGPDDRRGAGAGGDPHVKTWSGEYYDFHGQCDLVLVDAPSFDNCTGLTIHVQTEIRYRYSFIKQVAVAFGATTKEDPDVLIVSGWGQHIINAVSGASLPYDLAGKYTINHEKKDNMQDIFTVDLGDGQKLHLTTFKDWVNISLENASKKYFGDSKGLMGQFGTGAMLSRDGTTIISNPNEFGQHYQVLDAEPKLFPVLRPPQHPHQACIMPKTVSASSRRLGETIAREAAEKACAYHDNAHKEICVADVVMSGDLDVALAGAF